MSFPVMSPFESKTQNTFSALMWALSYPGRPSPLAGQDASLFELIGDTLIDLETSYYTPDEELAARLAFTGARSYPATMARYQFYPRLRPEQCNQLFDAPIGTYSHPDEGATLVIGCTFGTGQVVRLRGPGVPSHVDLQVAGIPPTFWRVRERALRYPLGWDLFLVTRDSVIGVPRSTTVEVR